MLQYDEPELYQAQGTSYQRHVNDNEVSAQRSDSSSTYFEVDRYINRRGDPQSVYTINSDESDGYVCIPMQQSNLPIVETDDYLTPYQKSEADSSYTKLSCRKVTSFIIIITMVLAMILGMIYLPPEKKEPKLHCDINFNEGYSNSECKEDYIAALQSVKSMKVIFKNKEKVTFNINLQQGNQSGIWTITNDGLNVISVSVDTSSMTCNDAGVYTLHYQDDAGLLVFQQNVTVIVNGNISQVGVEMIPHLMKDGVNKSMLMKTTMNTGCRHGILVPTPKKNGKPVFVEKASCTYSFSNIHGGRISCVSDIPDTVWSYIDEVMIELQPNTGLPSNIVSYVVKTSDNPLRDVFEIAYMEFGKPGIVYCKKTITSPVKIDVSHDGYFHGDNEPLISANSEDKTTALSNRVSLESSLDDDMLIVKLSFDPARCDDQGVFTFLFSDNATVSINVTIQKISELCLLSRRFETTRNNNFALKCSFCPGHEVKRLTIQQLKHADGHPAADVGVRSSDVLELDMTQDAPSVKKLNFTLTGKTENGLYTIELDRTKTACNDGGIYRIIAYTPNNSTSTMKEITVELEAPTKSFEDDFDTPPAYINNTKKTVTFEGNMGCSPTEVVINKDGNDIQPSQAIVRNEVFEQVAKVEWVFDPVTQKIHNKKLTVTVTFVRPSNIKQQYSRQAIVEVVDNSACADIGTQPQGCLVVHPNNPSKFIHCGAGLTIIGVSDCPAGLKFNPKNSCLGGACE